MKQSIRIQSFEILHSNNRTTLEGKKLSIYGRGMFKSVFQESSSSNRHSNMIILFLRWVEPSCSSQRRKIEKGDKEDLVYTSIRYSCEKVGDFMDMWTIQSLPLSLVNV